MSSAFAVAGLILTGISVIAYVLDRESFPLARYPLIPGGLLVWSIWGDGFESEAAFDRFAIPFTFAVNAAIGAFLGLIASLAAWLFTVAAQHRMPAEPR